MIDLEAWRLHAVELRKMILHCETASVRTRRESDFFWARRDYLKGIHEFLVDALKEDLLLD